MLNQKKLSEKYKARFLALDKNKESKAVVNKIIEEEIILDMDCVNWGLNQIEDFLKSFKCISSNSLSIKYSVFKNYVNFICGKEGILRKNIQMNMGYLQQLVDYDTLMLQTINFQQYKHIINQLKLNVRDKLICELGWERMTSDEISQIKKEDITFKTMKGSYLEIAFINTQNGKLPYKIEDPETVEDIKKCIEEKYYYVTTKKNIKTNKCVNKRNTFKESDYLIKPTDIGAKRKEEEGEKQEQFLANPNYALHQAIVARGVTCEGIDVNALNIESFRRSRIICMLAPENEEYFTKGQIKIMCGIDENSNAVISWYSKLAKMKYSG